MRLAELAAEAGLPEGVRIATLSPRAAFSRARAIGEPQLTSPCPASASSSPTRVIVSFPVALPSLISTVELPFTTIAEPVPAALRADLSALLEQARAAHDAFLAHRGEADRLVAAASSSPTPGDAPPSVAWSAANEALAELDANRADIARAQDRLERLYIDDRVAHAIADGQSGSATARPTGAAIAAARDTVLALVQQEDDILTALKSRLP